MANARNIVDYEGIAGPQDYATFKTDNSTIVYDSTKAGGAATTMIGKAVSLSADDTVQLASDGEAIVGKLLKVEADNKASVQVGGFMKLPGGASASLTRGLKVVGALGAASAKGYIREVASATAAEINKGRGMIIDNGDATAVTVRL
jgi:hypothetical protein